MRERMMKRMSLLFKHLGIKAPIGKIGKAAPRPAASFKGKGSFGKTKY